jgi:hypothetical protein
VSFSFPQRPGRGPALGDHRRRIEALERRHIKLPPGLLGGPGLNDTLDTLGFDAVWPFDDAAGSVAHDSTGNGHDLSTVSGFADPTWAQAAGPPGTQSALFEVSPASACMEETTTGTITGDFTAGVWFKGAGSKDFMGSGFFGGHSSHAGWALIRQATSGKLLLFVGNTTSGPNTVLSDNAMTSTDFHLGLITRIAGEWLMYVDGLLQAASYTEGLYTPAAGIWFGSPPSGVLGDTDGTMSYGMLAATRGLSGAEVLEVYNAGVTHGIPGSGTVPVAGGDGSVTYEPQTIAFYKDGV